MSNSEKKIVEHFYSLKNFVVSLGEIGKNLFFLYVIPFFIFPERRLLDESILLFQLMPSFSIGVNGPSALPLAERASSTGTGSAFQSSTAASHVLNCFRTHSLARLHSAQVG